MRAPAPCKMQPNPPPHGTSPPAASCFLVTLSADRYVKNPLFITGESYAGVCESCSIVARTNRSATVIMRRIFVLNSRLAVLFWTPRCAYNSEGELHPWHMQCSTCVCGFVCAFVFGAEA